MRYATVCSGIEACSAAWEPLECERLQGFPDGYTAIRGDKTPDTLRYQALGNSMAVPVMRWLGERIQKVENVLKYKK
jgi:site-specific DNA-cytosine methylase